MADKNRLVMVLSYLESIEDPYQYGDNYGDLVEYLKMLIEGEEEYVPEELNDTREEADLAEEEHAHAKWEKECKNKEFHTQIQAMLRRFKEY